MNIKSQRLNHRPHCQPTLQFLVSLTQFKEEVAAIIMEAFSSGPSNANAWLGPLPCTSSIGNTSACSHPRRVAGLANLAHASLGFSYGGLTASTLSISSALIALSFSSLSSTIPASPLPQRLPHHGLITPTTSCVTTSTLATRP